MVGNLKHYIVFALFVHCTLFAAKTGASVISITADEGEALDKFGYALSLFNNDLLIGAPGICFGENRGDVYHYRYSSISQTWQYIGSVLAVDNEGFDLFGRAVSLYDDYAIVGANGDCLWKPNGGQAYIFFRIVNSLHQIQKLTSENPYASDEYGAAVDINEKFAVVSAPLGAEGMAGKVYIYKRHNDVWALDTGIKAQDSQMFDYFGSSVALFDSTLVVGAPRLDLNQQNPKGSAAGSAYVFQRNNGQWIQTAKLQSEAPTANDQFGCAVDIDHENIVIGARRDDVLEFDSGSAYLYHKNGDQWNFTAKLSALDANADDYFGYAVALSGNFLVIGAPGVDGAGSNSGAIYSYLKTEEGWSQKAKTSPGDNRANDTFGAAVTISNEFAAIGAPYKSVLGSEAQGSVYIFDNIDDLALPVQLTDFYAELVDDDVILHWTTESELDNLGFIVQRRQNNRQWSEIASFASHPELEGRGSATTPASYSFVDQNVPADQYEYRIGDVNIAGEINFHDAIVIAVDASRNDSNLLSPSETMLFPAYPNPFNPETTIAFYVDGQSYIDLGIYDVFGKKSATLVQSIKQSGMHHITWRGQDDNGLFLSSGVYIIRLQSGKNMQTQKIVFVR